MWLDPFSIFAPLFVKDESDGDEISRLGEDDSRMSAKRHNYNGQEHG
jgi:hypothetical protein